MIQKLLLILIFLLLLAVLIANPAPKSFELTDLILVMLPCAIGMICLIASTDYMLGRVELDLFIVVTLYFSYLLISIWIGLLEGVQLLNVLRASGPYLNFFPLLLIGFLPGRLLNPWSLGIIFITVGMIQASYQLKIYGEHSHDIANTFDVLRGRITLLDPRTTLPIVFSVTVLPLVFFSKKMLSGFKQVLFYSVLSSLVLIGLFAGIVTLTRSIILSILVGWIVFLLCFYYYQRVFKVFSVKRLLPLGFGLACFVLLLGLLMCFIPKINLLAQGILARFFHQHSHMTGPDYSNGRIFNEWIPALSSWVHSNVLHLLFGMGAGNAFTVTTGEERTYIHNLSIYTLVYGGVFGFLASCLMYLILFKTLIIRALQTQQAIYLGFAALLASLGFYAQLFAVHKGLAYNAMLFLMLGLALNKPVQKESAICAG